MLVPESINTWNDIYIKWRDDKHNVVSAIH